MTQISNATWQQIGQPRQLGIWTNSISHREPSDGTPIRSTVHIQFHWWNYHYINPMSGLGFSQISASLSSHRSRVSRVSLELSISRRWGTPTFGTLIRRTTVLDLGLGECSDLQFFVFSLQFTVYVIVLLAVISDPVMNHGDFSYLLLLLMLLDGFIVEVFGTFDGFEELFIVSYGTINRWCVLSQIYGEKHEKEFKDGWTLVCVWFGCLPNFI